MFIPDDIIAEIYGYGITQSIIIYGFLTQTLFVVICQIVVAAPSPIFFKEQAAYINILGSSFYALMLAALLPISLLI